MTATGIVRRIDDLGRVVIPKEIRRNLKIKEGDPLEIFTTREGQVIFQKYHYCDEKDWQKAKGIVKALVGNTHFGIYDHYGDLQVFTKMGMPNYYDSREGAVYLDGDIICFIYFDGDILTETLDTIKKVLKEFFANN